VVGLVENPANFLDQFALVSPGQANPPDSVRLLIRTAEHGPDGVRFAAGVPLEIDARSSDNTQVAAVLLLVLATIGLVFVGLIAAAGFTVMAHRRLRALGMLGSIGATDRQVGLVMLANGALVGAVASGLGVAAGLAGWSVLAPHAETLVDHRIDRFALPWWAVGGAVALAVVTGVIAAWWPARSAARVPIVAALSGRPPRPQPARRFATLGAIALVAGLGALASAHPDNPVLIIGGVVGTTAGVLLLSPLAIRTLAAAGRRSPIGIRLAIRDLARYQARSGAALGAVTLAVAIAVTIAASAKASEAVDAAAVPNLAPNQLLVQLNSDGPGDIVPVETDAQLARIRTAVADMARSIGARTPLALEAAVDPTGPLFPLISKPPVGGGGAVSKAIVRVPGSDGGTAGGPVGRSSAGLARVRTVDRGVDILWAFPVFVATPELLARYGISPDQIRPSTDILTSHTDLAGIRLDFEPRHEITPTFQSARLSRYTEGPSALITTNAMHRLGLSPVPSAWLVETANPLKASQIDAARKIAAGANLTVETQSSRRSLSRLRTDATAAGVVVALGILAMTVGLIRSETANDLRTLTATGASRATRRTLTAATAGSLALLGSLLGTAGAYLALVAWNHRKLWPLGHVPVVDVLVLVVGLPLVATVGGFALGGQAPPAIARQPLE
jgi:putative ABC transport system permease protein